jgi:hypothetical protein
VFRHISGSFGVTVVRKRWLSSALERRGLGSSRFKCTSKLFPLLLIVFCNDFPANTADAGFQTQSADNLLEQQVLPAGARQSGLHLNLVRMLHVVALQRLEKQRLPT